MDSAVRGKAREESREKSRKLTTEHPETRACRQFFWRSVGRRWISRSCFYEQIEVGEIVKLFFTDGEKGCGRDGIV